MPGDSEYKMDRVEFEPTTSANSNRRLCFFFM